jgi:hypothetical protein
LPIVPSASLGPRCVACGADVGSTWRWCLACGHDPDGLRPDPDGSVVADAEPERSSWLPVVLCVVAIVVIGFLLMPRL